MPVPAEVAAYLQAKLAAAGYGVSIRVGVGVAFVYDENLLVFVYADAVSWLIGQGQATWLPVRDGQAVDRATAVVVQLFHQTRIPLAVEELRRRLGIAQVPTSSVDSEWAADGSGAAQVRTQCGDVEVTVTVSGGWYQWRSRDGEWRRLPWAGDAAERLAREIRTQLQEPGEASS